MGFFSDPSCCPPNPGSNAPAALTCPHGFVHVNAHTGTPPSSPLPGYYLVATPATGVFSGHVDQYAWFNGTAWSFCVPWPGDQVAVYGACGTLCWSGAQWVPSVGSPFTPELENVGTGTGIIGIGWTDSLLRLRKLRAGNGMGIAVDPNTGDIVLTVNFPNTSSGEANAGVNLSGIGAGVYKDKVGLNLRFRKLYSDNADLEISEDGDRIKFKVIIPAIPTYDMGNVGVAGAIVYDGFSAGVFNVRKVRAVTEDAAVFDVEQNNTDKTIDVVFKPSLGLLSLFGDAQNLYDVAISQDRIMAWDTTLGSWVHRALSLTNISATGATVYVNGGTPFAHTFKRFVAGSNVTISESGTQITIAASAGGTYNGANLGTGADGLGWYVDVVSNSLRFKRIKAGTNIVLTDETNDIVVATKVHTAGTGMTITPGVGDNTFSVTNYNTLLADAAVADASIIKSGPPWLLRKLRSGLGVTVTQSTDYIEFAMALLSANLGAGVAVLGGWSGATIQGRSIVAGAGIQVTLVGNEIQIANIGGGSSGAGVSGMALVGAWSNVNTSTALSRFGLTGTPVKFPSTTLAVSTVTKNGAHEEFTLNKAAKWKISAKCTLETGTYHTQHIMWCEVNTGGGWVEVEGTRSYAFTTNDVNDLQSVHTGEFTLQTSNTTSKIRFMAITSGGVLLPRLAGLGTSLCIEEAVGPIWEVITEAGPTRNIALSDNGKVILCTGAVAFTLPNTPLVSFSVDVIRQAAGAVSFTAGGGATVQSVSGATPSITAQHGRARLIVVSGTGANAVYNISGNI